MFETVVQRFRRSERTSHLSRFYLGRGQLIRTPLNETAKDIKYNVTRWLEHFWNIWPFNIIKISQKVKIICHRKFIILLNTKWTLRKLLNPFLKNCQMTKFWQNLATLIEFQHRAGKKIVSIISIASQLKCVLLSIFKCTIYGICFLCFVF